MEFQDILEKCSQEELTRLCLERKLGKTDNPVEELILFEQKNRGVTRYFDFFCQICKEKCLVRFHCSECVQQFCLCPKCHSKTDHGHHMYREANCRKKNSTIENFLNSGIFKRWDFRHS